MIEDYWKKAHLEAGYQLLYTPHIANLELSKTSDHLDFYRENMFDSNGEVKMIRFLDCNIETLQGGVYQLTHESGAKWHHSSLKACLEGAAKAWVLNCTHPAAAIKQHGWCLANSYALELGWPYSLYKLYPNQIYHNIVKLPYSQGIWRDIAYQKLLVSEQEVLLIKSLAPEP